MVRWKRIRGPLDIDTITVISRVEQQIKQNTHQGRRYRRTQLQYYSHPNSRCHDVYQWPKMSTAQSSNDQIFGRCTQRTYWWKCFIWHVSLAMDDVKPGQKTWQQIILIAPIITLAATLAVVSSLSPITCTLNGVKSSTLFTS